MFDFSDADLRRSYWHTSSHILAHAVKRLYPDVKLGIGPAIEQGFYYDFDRNEPFSSDELKDIEKEMKKIIKAKIPLERFELDRDAARRYMMEREEPYKVELIDDLPADAVISFYRQDDFTDL
ncbi:MAG: threonine--tRNA ligase, partial [Eubacteriales bacterium]|nr:threonine--tRNA ligase [Eubacteriales bacterium]